MEEIRKAILVSSEPRLSWTNSVEEKVYHEETWQARTILWLSYVFTLTGFISYFASYVEMLPENVKVYAQFIAAFGVILNQSAYLLCDLLDDWKLNKSYIYAPPK